jgi:hypothetical protein
LLTAKHLAVIRAALMFWDEELSSHDPAISAPYLVGPIASGEWIKDAVADLPDRLASCQMRYVLCSPDGTSLISNQLFESLDQARIAADCDSASVATLILFAAGD